MPVYPGAQRLIAEALIHKNRAAGRVTGNGDTESKRLTSSEIHLNDRHSRTWNDHEFPWTAKPLQFLPDDLFRFSVHCETKHSFTYAGDFNAQTLISGNPSAPLNEFCGNFVPSFRQSICHSFA